jgi:hypothetical protein
MIKKANAIVLKSCANAIKEIDSTMEERYEEFGQSGNKSKVLQARALLHEVIKSSACTLQPGTYKIVHCDQPEKKGI